MLGSGGYILWCAASSWKRCLLGALIPPGPILHTVGVWWVFLIISQCGDLWVTRLKR